jgi:phosphoglycerol transferase MdoB-like AlkP superfamily enzyme
VSSGRIRDIVADRFLSNHKWPTAETHRRSFLKPPFRSPLLILLTFLACLAVGRGLLLFSYWPDFDQLSAWGVVSGFLWGLRFDLSITITFIGLPLLLLALPARAVRRPAWQRFWGWLCWGVLVLFVLVIGSDLVYFSFVHRHVGSEIVPALASDAPAVLRMLFDYPLALTAAGGVAVGFGFLWPRLLEAPREALPGRRQDWAVWVCLVPLLVIAIRGGLQFKPVNVVNAFQSGSVAEGYLTLNAPFSAYHSARETRSGTDRAYYSLEDALRNVRDRIEEDGDVWSEPEYPLQRHSVGGGAAVPDSTNIVVLVLESWDALVTDAIRDEVGLEPIGVTPNFDALARDGLLFSRFLASGQRSIEGMAAILASVPTLPGLPYLGTGMEQSRLSFLGDMAAGNGYSSVFVRSAKRGSFYLDAVSALAGFDVYAGAEDILSTGSHSSEPPGFWGAWDFDSLRFLHERRLESERPFLGVFVGSTTHPPFLAPGDEWRLFEPDTDRDRFLNAVHYVDWALGRFMEMAKEGGYYDDTVFVILADQTSGFEEAETVVDRHWIPALVVGPGLPKGSVDERVGSQMDLIPTLVDLFGWTNEHASFGTSLLGAREGAALLKNGELVVQVGAEGWVMHDLTRRVGGEGEEEHLSELEQALLSAVQVAGTLLSRNRLFSGS